MRRREEWRGFYVARECDDVFCWRGESSMVVNTADDSIPKKVLRRFQSFNHLIKRPGEQMMQEAETGSKHFEAMRS